MTESALCTTREACERLFLNKARRDRGEIHATRADMYRLYRMINKGQIKAKQVGERKYIPDAEIERLTNGSDTS